MTPPKFFRPVRGNRIGWEIHDRHRWFVTVSLFKTFEMQFNKWGD